MGMQGVQRVQEMQGVQLAEPRRAEGETALGQNAGIGGTILHGVRMFQSFSFDSHHVTASLCGSDHAGEAISWQGIQFLRDQVKTVDIAWEWESSMRKT